MPDPLAGSLPNAWQRSQRRMFMLLAWLVTLGCLAALWVQAPRYDPLDRWALPALATLFLGLQLLLSLRLLKLRAAFLTGLLGGSVYLLLVLNHQFGVLPPQAYALMESTYWFAALYAALFLALSARQATLASSALLGVAAVICALNLAFTVPAGVRPNLYGPVLQFLLVGAVMIVMQATFGEQHARLLLAQAAANTDVLTGLANRRAAEERLSALARSAAGFTLVLFDLDHFKQVNDQHGHATGDLVLRGVARAALAHLPAGGLAARWGGEEFLLILPHLQDHQVRDMLGTLRGELLAQRHGKVSGVTACFGVASARPGEHPDQVLERADAAMYSAKQQGRNDIRLAEPPARPTDRSGPHG